MNFTIRHLWPALAGAALLLSGCATATASSDPADNDPLQPFNRAMYRFNDTLDRAVLKPVAKGYVAVTPDFVRTGVTNFFGNIGDVAVFVNDLLQGKLKQGSEDGVRFLMNTTMGIFGFFDVATSAGLPHHREDFGQTLAVWGWENSTYLVLPLLGPSTLRDSMGLVGDYPVGLYANLHTTYTKEAEIYSFQVVNTRSNLLAATNVLEIAALDPYAFMRDAYLQQRRNLIYDGHPPPLPDDEQ
ncbi:MAG: VacJ family lipoprotein [Betaproteobacteria bacterium]|nr:VacJ family lipoprotein [Betaproteobacteria bacterium]